MLKILLYEHFAMWLIIFILIVFFLLLLPLLPSLVELIYATDVAPLKVVQEYDADVKFFANGFKSYLQKNFGDFFEAAIVDFREGTLKDGTNFQIIEQNGGVRFNKIDLYKRTINKLIISAGSLQLTSKLFYEKEIYSKHSVNAEDFSKFRALMSEENIWLGNECSILRWVHSNSSLVVGKNCKLFGRASADEAIFLGSNSNFQRLHANKIHFGEAVVIPQNSGNINKIVLEKLPNVKDRYKRRWIVDGDAEIPENNVFDGDIVATKDVKIGSYSHIMGSLKSNADMYIAMGAHIDGSVVSAGKIFIEAACQIKGTVLAEELITMKEGNVIGAENSLTTVTAPYINISGGTVVFGTVWADESGQVV